jgi:hypothetical protein
VAGEGFGWETIFVKAWLAKQRRSQKGGVWKHLQASVWFEAVDEIKEVSIRKVQPELLVKLDIL